MTSYREVLDATKHTDDKIGRLLTGIAFLTAAALAIAGLSSARYVVMEFDVDPFTVPLGLICLGAFLAGVLVAVMVLLTAFNAPLKLPGFEGRRAAPAAITWANGVAGSTVYFHQIAGLPVEKWVRKWSAATDALLTERVQGLPYEIHNLAQRADYKTVRIRTATAYAGIAILALMLSAGFVLIAASRADASLAAPPQPIRLAPFHRLIVGMLFAAAAWVQSRARLAESRELVGSIPEWRTAVFPVAVAAALLALVVDAPHGLVGSAIIGGLGLLAALSYGHDATRADRGAAERGPAQSPASRRSRRATQAVIIAVALAGVLLAASPWYGWRLALAAFGYVLLVVQWPRAPRRPGGEVTPAGSPGAPRPAG